jgi:ferrous iron transport protein B
MKETKRTLKVALVGNPNSGKTSLFNKLTGLHQKVGNFPGITVEKKSGSFSVKQEVGNLEVELVDLPGTYSLEPRSIDEKVAADAILNKQNQDHPDLTLIVVDASHLRTSLYLALQVMEQRIPVILVLNMADQMNRLSADFDASVLGRQLSVPVLLTNARDGVGTEQLKQAIANHDLRPAEAFWATMNVERHIIIRQLLERAKGHQPVVEHAITRQLDDVLVHPIWGIVVFIGLLAIIFQGIYSWSAYPMESIEMLFGYSADLMQRHLPDHFLSRLAVEGIWAGLGGVVVFIPQIALLFLFVTLLEESGYMARVSFLTDRTLRRFGLQGRSIVPLLGGVACAVPAILAARTIPDRRERLITILVTPFMSCSARLPVYTLIIALIIPAGYQGLALLAMYLLGVGMALLAAFVLKRTLPATKETHFLLELPDYRLPRVSAVAFEIVRKVWQFVSSAGKLIVLISVLLWFGASYGPQERMELIESQYGILEQTEENRNAKQAAILENSYVGILGNEIEPIIRPLGYDWKIGIALITSFAAREVFVGTMATINSVGSDDGAVTLRDRMMAETDENGRPLYDLAFGLSLLVFYAFAMQCMSTLAVVKAETGTWKWPLFQLLFMTGLAYISALAVYETVRLF